MTLKSAVVGGGEVSTAHLSGLASHPAVDLRAVCDTDEQRAGDRASTYDIRAYGDFEGMLALESLDWVHVCTPTGVHFEQARMALEDDLAVQMEAPLTERAPAAEELAILTEGSDGRVSVASPGVFEPPIRRAEGLIEEGVIGRLRAVDLLATGEPWPHEIGERDWVAGLSGGAFEAALPRPISQLIRLGGYPESASSIAGCGTRRDADGDQFDFDSATFQYTTADGICCSGTVVASDVPRRVIRVHGDRGTLVVDLIAESVRIVDRGSENSLAASVRDSAGRILGKFRNSEDERTGSTWNDIDDDVDVRSPHEAQIAAEVSALQRGDPFPVPIESGVWTVHVIDAIRPRDSEDESHVRAAPVIDAA